MIENFKVIVSAVIFNENGEVLLGKRSQDEEAFPGLWGIPGGKVEIQEGGVSVIESTLVREVKEEVGIEVRLASYVGSSCRIGDSGAKLYLIYTAEHVSGEPEPLHDTAEVGWFQLEEIARLKLTPHTYENITLAYNERAASPSGQ